MKPLVFALVLAHGAWGQAFDPAVIRERVAANGAAAALYHGILEGQVGLEFLPKDCKYEENEVSVMPNPKDRYEGRIAVYLINATDHPIGGEGNPFQEVLVGGKWKKTHPISISTCAMGYVAPPPIAPRSAIIFLQSDPSVGDLEGTLRYVVNLRGETVVASEPFKGRFPSKEFDAADEGLDSPSFDPRKRIPFHSALMPGWTIETRARKCEEVIAALHLERSYDEATATRRAATRWQQLLAKEVIEDPCRVALRELLATPWPLDHEEASLFNRCRQALTADESQNWSYGAPERFRNVVWEYLADLTPDRGAQWCNPERKAELDVIRASGNPWGVDRADAVALLGLAAERLKSAPAEETEAAGRFLRGSWIKDSHFPDEAVRRLLEIDSPHARRTALTMLINRGKQEEASAWLAGHHRELRKEMKVLLPLVQTFPAPFQAWQTECALGWMKDDFKGALGYLLQYSERNKRREEAELPRELRAPILRFLEDEADRQRIKSDPLPTRDAQGKLRDPQGGDIFARIAPLKIAVLVLVQWKDPADDELFKKLSAHPAAYYEVSDDKASRYFEVRAFIVDTLKENKRAIPDGVVTREDVEIP